ncbi:MAG TPA: hypothetical protein PKE69_24225, partial [Pyrinomonadaceae bacterium]|nr:hypothetical protein [Pyrinomonadaceae bacterium]
KTAVSFVLFRVVLWLIFFFFCLKLNKNVLRKPSVRLRKPIDTLRRASVSLRRPTDTPRRATDTVREASDTPRNAFV